jgi:putative transposase
LFNLHTLQVFQSKIENRLQTNRNLHTELNVLISNKPELMKTFYKRRLPHIQPIGASFFVTFRLADSTPYAAIKMLKESYTKKIEDAKKIQSPHARNYAIFNLRKQYLVDYDALLHQIKTGPMHMKDPEILEIVKTQLQRFDGELYKLIAYCVMSNHVHILIDTSIQLEDIELEEELEMKYTTLDKIMKKVKGPSGWYANRYLNRHGQFWDRESFDIYIRNEKMHSNVINYIFNNPVAAKMVKSWQEYEGNYYHLANE